MCVVRTFFNYENAQRPPQFNKRQRKLKKTKNKTKRWLGEEKKARNFGGPWLGPGLEGRGQEGGGARGRGPEKDYLEKMKFLFYKKFVLKTCGGRWVACAENAVLMFLRHVLGVVATFWKSGSRNSHKMGAQVGVAQPQVLMGQNCFGMVRRR